MKTQLAQQFNGLIKIILCACFLAGAIIWHFEGENIKDRLVVNLYGERV